MKEPDSKVPGLPSLEEVREWRRKMDEAQEHCVAYSLSAEGFDYILRMAEAERYYEKQGLL
jgi:hypothetical protein